MEKNMLRDRGKGLPIVTDEMWNSVEEHNRDIVDEFLDSNKHLSKQSIKQYTSGLRQFFYFVKTNLKDKPLYKITKRDFIKYFSWLQENGLSSSSLKFKKSAVSTLCKFVENIIAEDEEEYETFRNFTVAIKDIPSNKVYEKIAITQDEYELIMKVLQERNNYLGMAWVATAFNVGARRNEIIQFKTEITEYEKEDGLNFIETHVVMGKGRAGGKPIKYMVNDEAMKYIKLWIEKRDYECEYIFSTIRNGNPKCISSAWADDFCNRVLSKICDRRINVHLFKSSCVTKLLEDGVDMSIVSKYVAQHESTETTKLYDLRDDTEAKNNIFK